MPSARVRLVPDLSAETCDAVQSYVNTFGRSRGTFAAHDGVHEIVFRDHRDCQLFQAQFPTVVANVEEIFRLD